MWTPAAVDLKDKARAAPLLDDFGLAFSDASTLTGVFVPGGDPDNNPPELLLPCLEQIASRLKPVRPRAKVWLSLQGFSAADANVVYA